MESKNVEYSISHIFYFYLTLNSNFQTQRLFTSKERDKIISNDRKSYFYYGSFYIIIMEIQFIIFYL